MNENLSKSYDKHYKVLLIIPIAILIISLSYIFLFSAKTGDIISKDISLTGGTSIQVNSGSDVDALTKALESKFSDVSIRKVTDSLSGKQLAFVIETSANSSEVVLFLEQYLGYKLNSDNSSVEFTGPSIGAGFYIQLLLAILFAFIFMGTVVFFIFADSTKIRLFIIFLSLLAPSLFFIFKIISINQAFIISFAVLAVSLYFYVRYSIPSLAVVFCAFADMTMTLAVVNFLGMKISSAGIIAFIMLIGYSVDTDILLTTRVLKRRGENVNSRIWGSFKTGITMTLTAIVVVLIGYFLTASFSKVLHQLFFILTVGLFFDILNTWITNASIIKWYTVKHKIE